MLLPIALSVFGQLVTPVLSPSAPAPLPGWSWEGGFYQPSELGAAQTSPTPTWSCGAKLLTGRDIVGSNLIQSDCDSFNTNPAEEYDPTNGKYLVPCVVHVITDGSTGFLSLGCVQNNIDTMNQDFLALSGTPGQLGVDAQIEFYLADVDPSGNPTNGVTYTDNAEWFQEADPLELSSLEYRTTLSWDPDRYVNIFVLQINFPASGYVYLPVDPCNCVAGNPLYDGVHVDHRYWGNCSQNSAWAGGRVLTHEMGHYLGLFHTFEGGCDSGLCSESGDLICDTNPEADPASGCGNSSSCGSPDPDRNYMDYGDPYCSLEFTPNQIRRMRCVLESYRPQLGTLVFPGACCFEDGSCELATESGCADVGGTYQGEGSACEPNNCPQPPTLGACCLPDLSCSEVEASECATLGGDYKGDDSVCASFNCAAGACCFANGSCVVETESDCGVNGGIYSGDNTLCVPNPCPQPPAIGACCASDGSCSEQTEADCQVAGGVYSGDGASCSPNPCSQPPVTGACCALDGSCREQTEADCQSSGGSYSDDGTSCAPNPCPQPPATGACCSDDGSCAVLTQTSCAASGGIYQGDDTGCEAVVCSDDVVITVDDDFGENPQANFNSIQDAINAASDGAIILVYPGTYTGNLDFVLDFGSKSVAVQSTSGASQTSIDAEWSRGLVNFNGTTEGVASLVGFTLQNCDVDAVPPVAFNTPSAINILNGASVEIADCVVQDVINGVGGASGVNSLVLHVAAEEGFDCGQILVENCSFSGVSLEEGHFAGVGNCDVNFVSCLFSGIQVLETSNNASMFDVYQASIEILDSEIINCESSSRFFDASGVCEIRDSKILGSFALDWDASSTSIGSSELCDNTPPLDGYIDLGGNFDCTPDLGACCVSGECLNLTEAICQSVGGSFRGLGSSCTDFGCTDCNNDGLDDLVQIQSGTLKDYDGNLVPDVCEAVQWSVESGGNGHWYQVTQAGEIDWYESELFSIAKGGHLVSITSSAENEFLLGLFDESIFNGSRGPWIGGLQPAGSSEPDGGWSWSNGDVFDFTGWIEGAPDNNCNGINEDRIHFGSPSEGIVGWDDLPGTDSCVDPPKSFITEWSADCNNDGLVDFGQLISGALEDKNNDGVPDCCADGQTCEPDCDGDGIPDKVEIETGQAGDQNQNCIPDNCEPDCDGDGTPDFVEILQGAFDCNANGVPDSCDIADGLSEDSNGNTFPDECEIDCNGNGIFDFLDLFGGSQDCDGNNVPDECDIADGTQQDCNADGVPDACTSFDDCDTNGVPDECQPDTDQDGDIDACDSDDDDDDVPDECDPDSTGGLDCDLNGIDDSCDPDTDGDTIPDACDDDIDGDGVPNECDVDSAPSAEIANSMSDFSNVQGQSNWSYLWQSETGAINEYLLYGTGSCRDRTGWANACAELLPNLTKDGWQIRSFCGSCGGIQPVRRYTFANAGNYRLELDGAEASFTASVEFVIRLNGLVLASFVQADFPLAYEAELVVQEGDELDLALLDTSLSPICGCDVYCDAVAKLFGSSPDCNSNGIIDSCELDGNDCNSNGVPDGCELAGNDCNANGVPDECDLVNGDCNMNSIPDVCEQDTDGDTVPDDCDDDIDGDGVPNECDVDQFVPLSADSLTGFSDVQGQDGWRYRYSEAVNLDVVRDMEYFCDGGGCAGYPEDHWSPDFATVCTIAEQNIHPSSSPLFFVAVLEYTIPRAAQLDVSIIIDDFDANILDGTGAKLLLGDQVLDSWVFNGGVVEETFSVQTSGADVLRFAVDTNGAQQNGDGLRYRLQISESDVPVDCNGNGILDLCELDSDSDGTIDDCDPDDDNDGVPDECDPDSTGGSDCDANGVDDLCELGDDCNSNSVPDRCESDLDEDGVIDDCDPDDDGDGVPDECDPRWTGGDDCDANGIDDTCEPDLDEDGTIDACDPDIDGDGIPNVCDVLPGEVAEQFACCLQDGTCNTKSVIECATLGGFVQSSDIDCSTSDCPNALEAEWIVDDDYGQRPDADFSSIQEAVDAAQSGDTIVVYPGTYGSSTADMAIDITNKDLKLYGFGGEGAVLVDGQGTQGFLRCVGEVSRSTIVQGFTFTGGNESVFLVHLFGQSTSPVIRDCNFVSTSSEQTIRSGPSNCCQGGSGLFERCRFKDIYAANKCVYADYSPIEFVGCEFVDVTTADESFFTYHPAASMRFESCVFKNITSESNGTNNGVFINRSGGSIFASSCTFIRNQSLIGSVFDSATSIQNSTFCDNQTPLGPYVDLGGNTECPIPALQWPEDEGGNGHWYQYVEGDRVCWNTANQLSQDVYNGHLASITSEAEGQFLIDLSGPIPGDSGGQAWIGLFQDPNGEEPLGGWGWTTGELLEFTNWGSCCSETDLPGSDYGTIVYDAGTSPPGVWNDYPNCFLGGRPQFFVEWSADCNNDGIVDYGQILDGTFADEDQNGVPDCCDQGVPCSSPSGEDCNGNGVLDSCELEDNDCNTNGIPDDCEMFDDCNANGLGDPCDIAAGTSQDINADGVPDECQCIADFVSDGVVDFQEVLAILNDWGPCGPPCPPDINADGVVSFIDLLRVLDAWGPCDP